MYNYLLNEGDSIKKLDAVQRLDLNDYVNMRMDCLPTMVKWQSIRSMVITEQGMTLWQLSEKYLDSEPARAIGSIESPVNLFKWIS